MRPRIDALDDDAGVEIVDPIENQRFLLRTDRDVSPTPAPTGSFPFPVSVARTVVTGSLRLPYTVTVVIRDGDDGAHVRDVGYEGTHELVPDDYLVEVNAPMKLYLRVRSSLSVTADTDSVAIEFGDASRVAVGARSRHDSPAATVTVTDDPADAMAAVSTFGSGLKTASCERSWPNLRGHPPAVERGDELAIPDELAVPDTGVTVHVPPEHDHVYAVAPLAYYLGASVVPGEPPRVTADTGFRYRLDGPPDGDDSEHERNDRSVAVGVDETATRTVDEAANRLLERVFVLDCVTRTEGFHPMDLHERRVLSDHPEVDLDFADLYGAPLGEQLEAYCSVPADALADATPTWHRVTHVRPTPDAVELLPYVVDGLSLIRVASPADASTAERARDPDPGGESADSSSGRAALDAFKRRPPAAPEAATDGATGVPPSDEYVPLPASDASTRAWIGEGTPVHGAKLLRPAFRHDRSAPTESVIDVTVVCNDPGMRAEWDAVSDAYGTGEAADVVPFDVDCRFDVSTDDLRELLADDHDVCHFVGHVDGRGLECPDGVLDAERLDRTGATTVLLNACRSHDQGVALVEAGARAAIVSWADVDNAGAVDVGEAFARLLGYGYNVGGALEVVERFTDIGRHYTVVGDPGVTVAQCVDMHPAWCRVDRDPDDPPAPDEEVDVTVGSYATRDVGVGGVVEPYFGGDAGPDYYLVPGENGTFTNTGAELRDMIGDQSVPIDADGTLCWADTWL